jgi:hypothetical protein
MDEGESADRRLAGVAGCRAADGEAVAQQRDCREMPVSSAPSPPFRCSDAGRRRAARSCGIHAPATRGAAWYPSHFTTHRADELVSMISDFLDAPTPKAVLRPT